MSEETKRKLRILFNILNSCASEDIISLKVSVSIKGDVSKNIQYIDYYTNLYTRKLINHND